MEVKCGIDIIEVARVKQSIEELGEGFLSRVYTAKEIAYCEAKKVVKFEHYAARFAAKEAVLKAVSTCLNNKYDIKWTDIEIVNTTQGKPEVVIHKPNLEIWQIDISMSHIKEYAIANCVLQLKNMK